MNAFYKDPDLKLKNFFFILFPFSLVYSVNMNTCWGQFSSIFIANNMFIYLLLFPLRTECSHDLFLEWHIFFTVNRHYRGK